MADAKRAHANQSPKMTDRGLGSAYCLHFFDRSLGEWSTTLPLSDYGRVARDSAKIAVVTVMSVNG
jgi:hypothetical protein